MTNKEVVLALIEAIDRRDLDAIGRLVAPNVEAHSNVLHARGREAYLENWRRTFAASSSSSTKVENIAEEGDTVAVSIVVSALLDGPVVNLDGSPLASPNQQVRYRAAAFVTVADNQIIRESVVIDYVPTLRAMGVLG